MPEVNVGIVTYETRDLTVDAIGRLLAGTGDVDVSVLVHDNASTDGTADAIVREVPQAEVERSPVNVGFAAGVNRLLARSTAPFFLALNSDAWPEPGAVRRLVDDAVAHPHAAIVAPRLERPDGTLEHSTFPFPSVGVAAITAVGGYRRLWPQRSRELALIGAWDHEVAREVDWAVGAAWLLRREAVDDVGGLDESFFMYAEDLEWCWRARQRGWAVRFQPSAVVRHVGNASGNKAYGDRRTREHTRNSYRFFRRTHGAVATAAFRALNVAGYSRLYALARLRHDEAARGEWAQHIRAHVAPQRERVG